MRAADNNLFEKPVPPFSEIELIELVCMRMIEMVANNPIYSDPDSDPWMFRAQIMMEMVTAKQQLQSDEGQKSLAKLRRMLANA